MFSKFDTNNLICEKNLKNHPGISLGAAACPSKELIDEADRTGCAGENCTAEADIGTCCKATCQTVPEASLFCVKSGALLDAPSLNQTTCKAATCTQQDDEATCCKASCATFPLENCKSKTLIVIATPSDGEGEAAMPTCRLAVCEVEDAATCCQPPAKCSSLDPKECPS